MDQQAKMRQGRGGKVRAHGGGNPQRPGNAWAGGRISKRAGKRGGKRGRRH